MIKVIGSVFIIISAALLGFYFSMKDSYRLKDLQQIQKLGEMLLSQFEFSKESLFNSLENISQKLEFPYSHIILNFSNKLAEKTGDDIVSIFSKELEKNTSIVYLSKEDRDNLYLLIKNLDFSDIEIIKRNINNLLIYIKNEESKIREKIENNKRMYRSTGVFTGLVIVIILI